MYFVYTNLVERLWEQDDPAVSEPHLPSFPLIKKKEHYEIGLFWKGSERPGDNKKQAMAALKSSLKRLETKPDAKSQYEGVLMNEYAELEAIEQDPDPDSRGYYLPHHQSAGGIQRISQGIRSEVPQRCAAPGTITVA